jgi:hypothetical protein
MRSAKAVRAVDQYIRAIRRDSVERIKLEVCLFLGLNELD